MRQMSGIGLAVAALVVTAGCAKKDGTASSAPASLEGNWTLVSHDSWGKMITEADIAKLPAEERTIRATGDQLIATERGKEEAVNYKLDPTKTPAEIDLIDPRPDATPGRRYGIYKLEGDTLTLCIGGSADPVDRPKEFNTGPSHLGDLMVLKRD